MDTIIVISSVMLWGLTLLNLLLTLSLSRRVRDHFPPVRFLTVGQDAPEFVAWTLENQQITLSQLLENMTAFVFISPNCAPCRAEILKLEALEIKAKRCGVALFVVSDGSESETRQLIEQCDAFLRTLIAPRELTSFFHDYRADITPSYCVLSDTGVVEATGPGLLGLEEFINNLDSLSAASSGKLVVAK